jgi:hypothetical protein
MARVASINCVRLTVSSIDEKKRFEYGKEIGQSRIKTIKGRPLTEMALERPWKVCEELSQSDQ